MRQHDEILRTRRLYWDDDHCLEADALVVAVRENSIAFDETCFYPGGGGQPYDTGSVVIQGKEPLEIVAVESDAADIIWHVSSTIPAQIVGSLARLVVNSIRRQSLARYHTVLHVLNTIALRDYGAWITGVQIAEDYSRIDFNWDNFSATLLPKLIEKVNAVIDANHILKSYNLSEDEFFKRKDLLRTLEVKPPVNHGQVRVVEIGGFDAQACGGTHVRTTSEVGRFSIFRTENKGKINKRLYVRLH